VSLLITDVIDILLQVGYSGTQIAAALP